MSLGPSAQNDFGRVTLNLSAGQPLLERAGLSQKAAADVAALLNNVEPLTFFDRRHTPQSARPASGDERFQRLF